MIWALLASDEILVALCITLCLYENDDDVLKNISNFFFQVQNDASQTSNSRSNGVPHGGRYTPLSALASLQPGGAGAQTGPHQGSSRFQSTSTYQHPFAPHQGDYIFYSYKA